MGTGQVLALHGSTSVKGNRASARMLLDMDVLVLVRLSAASLGQMSAWIHVDLTLQSRLHKLASAYESFRQEINRLRSSIREDRGEWPLSVEGK